MTVKNWQGVPKYLWAVEENVPAGGFSRLHQLVSIRKMQFSLGINSVREGLCLAWSSSISLASFTGDTKPSGLQNSQSGE